MVRPYSIDLRVRVVAGVRSDATCREVAARFGVAVSTVVKWSGRERATGTVKPGQMGGHRTPVLAVHRDWLLARVHETPEITLHALKDELRQHCGVKVSHDTVWRFLRGEGLSFKKNAYWHPSRIGLTLPDGAHNGNAIRIGSTREDWFSSTKPGPRPAWHPCVAGDRAARA